MASPTVLSQASPEELLRFIVTYHHYPTTLLVCSSRTEFMKSLVQALLPPPSPSAQDPNEAFHPTSRLLQTPLYQEAVARHIGVSFATSVTSVRSFLSALSRLDSITNPPPIAPPVSTRRPPLFLCYGFLEAHRDTSEWSAQGLMNSIAALVDTTERLELKAVIVEPRGSGGYEDFKSLLHDPVPVLSGGSRRDDGSWAGRTVEMKQILSRWFRYEDGQWDVT